MRYRYREPHEMKDSSVEWLGKIPRGWGTSKIKFISSVYNGNSLNDQQKEKFTSNNSEDLPYISSKDLELDKSIINYENGIRIPKVLKDFKIANENTSLLCIEGGSAGRKLAFTDQKVCFVNKLACFSNNKNCISKYLFYTIRGNLFQKQFNLSMSGLIGGVSLSNIKNFVIHFPKLTEQQKITDFLDKKTAEFDALVEKKESFIAKLEEAKKSLISEVVTGKKRVIEYRGQLRVENRRADEMIDSGIECGMIPGEWEVGKLKYYLIKGKDGIKIGPFGSSLKLEEMNEKYPIKVYGQENLINENFDIGERFISIEKFETMKNYEIVEHDIVISMMGTIGKSMVVPKTIKKGIMDSHLIKIRLNKEMSLPYFINLIIRNSSYVKEQIKISSKGSIMSGLNSNIIKNLTLLIPSLKEQQKILDFLDQKIYEIDATIKKIKFQIEKLKEAKQSLISEAVTGKIEVLD